MNEELKKRLKSGLWIIFAGVVAEIATLTLNLLPSFKLGTNEKLILTILLTAIVSQITKYLNK